MPGRTGRSRLEDRILSAAIEPTTLNAIVEHANARKADVKKAVRQLVDQGRLHRNGQRRGLRYTTAK